MPRTPLACAAVLVAAAAAFSAACRSAPSLPHPAGCVGQIAISVAIPIEGPAPRLDWLPVCGISELTVTTVPPGGGSGTVVWDVAALDTARIGPPVTIGRAPEGSVVRQEALPLVPGTTYRVVAHYIVGGDAVAGGGETTFKM